MAFQPDKSMAQRSAANILRMLAEGCESSNGFGSLSTAVYDTAWVAMVSRTSNGSVSWPFKESFQYILDIQANSGGWDVHLGGVDTILSSMASLLAILVHREAVNVRQDDDWVMDLDRRIGSATEFLKLALCDWDIESTDHVGFEILVPSLLRLLERKGIQLEFPKKQLLNDLNYCKLKKFQPELLYSDSPTSLIHSLEAFIGMIDFDRVKHRLVSGSMMGSPSSTAAYLIHSSYWDDEAERYLRLVIAHSSGKGNGSVPSAFPTTVFEASWALSTLVQNLRPLIDLDGKYIAIISEFFSRTFLEQGGKVGFAPGVLPDADDTAKVITSLNLLRMRADPDAMIASFGNSDHFRTYVGERNPSFSANCNVLNSILHLPEPDKYTSEIQSAFDYLYYAFWAGNLRDKWNLSLQYSLMLLAQTLSHLFVRASQGDLPSLPAAVLDKAASCLARIASQTLQTQAFSGSWFNKSVEITAYAVITLQTIANGFFGNFQPDLMNESISKGKRFLSQNSDSWSQGERHWVEKTSYSSSIISAAYCSAAMGASFMPSLQVQTNIKIPVEKGRKMAEFFSRLPLLSTTSRALVELAALEGLLLIPTLSESYHSIIPKISNGDDKYREYSPVIWFTCNRIHGDSIDLSTLKDMITLSMLLFEIDEYFDCYISIRFKDNLDIVRGVVAEAFRTALAKEPHLTEQMSRNGFHVQIPLMHRPPEVLPTDFRGSTSSLHELEQVIVGFMSWILSHPGITKASAPLQAHLREELYAFLMAHITQLEDNAMLEQQMESRRDQTLSYNSGTSYYNWVHTTSANHTSCPLAFFFFWSMISKASEEVFPGIREQYLCHDLCRHLAIMCRQYNDYGSAERDHAERNLNSIHFPEFKTNHVSTNLVINGGAALKRNDDERSKENLLWIAEYERCCMNEALKRLQDTKALDGEIRAKLQVFIDVTDLYGQLYVVRDITNRKEAQAEGCC